MGDENGTAVPAKPAFNLTGLDKWILTQDDDTFQKHDWADLKRIIGEPQTHTPTGCSPLSLSIH